MLHGSTLKRVLFGGGRRAKLSIIEIVVAAIVFLYTLLRLNTGIIFAVIIGLSAVVILYSFVELNVIRKRNGTEKYQRMIDSLTAEKASMEKELARLIAAKNGLEQ
ncbi:hypothetical protein [Enterococcus sp.]|uniref:hypothetical protein n=1 Tax=Enterococcus sp. TaxID=35783 RepID=UPI002648595E|nr:hypothetical protein [Enterococcus sp.]